MANNVDSKFPGAEKHEISLEEAREHIRRHKKNPIHPNHHGGWFDRAALDKILAHPECKRVRYYHGRDESGKPNLVLVGTDASGKDLTASIMEKSGHCPPDCDTSSVLLNA